MCGIVVEIDLVAVGPVDQPGEIEDGVVETGVEVARFAVAAGDGGDGEIARLDIRYLVPGHRGGDGGGGDTADRIGGGDGVVAGVLVVVDEQQSGVAVAAPPGGGH